MKTEPWTAPLHGFARAILRPQAALVEKLRGPLERAPHWVLLVARGRKSGLPREVLLPCGRHGERVVVVSTYGWRSAWVHNLKADPDVQYTADGVLRAGRAEIVEDALVKRALAETVPFVPLVPSRLVFRLSRNVLRPLVVPWLRRWVRTRPMVVIRPR